MILRPHSDGMTDDTYLKKVSGTPPEVSPGGFSTLFPPLYILFIFTVISVIVSLTQ